MARGYFSGQKDSANITTVLLCCLQERIPNGLTGYDVLKSAFFVIESRMWILLCLAEVNLVGAVCLCLVDTIYGPVT